MLRRRSEVPRRRAEARRQPANPAFAPPFPGPSPLRSAQTTGDALVVLPLVVEPDDACASHLGGGANVGAATGLALSTICTLPPTTGGRSSSVRTSSGRRRYSSSRMWRALTAGPRARTSFTRPSSRGRPSRANPVPLDPRARPELHPGDGTTDPVACNRVHHVRQSVGAHELVPKRAPRERLGREGRAGHTVPPRLGRPPAHRGPPADRHPRVEGGVDERDPTLTRPLHLGVEPLRDSPACTPGPRRRTTSLPSHRCPGPTPGGTGSHQSKSCPNGGVRPVKSPFTLAS